MIKRWIGVYVLGLLAVGGLGLMAWSAAPLGEVKVEIPQVSLRTHISEAALVRSVGRDYIPAQATSARQASFLPPMIYRGERSGGLVAGPGLGMRWSDGALAKAWFSTDDGAYELQVEMPQPPAKPHRCTMAERRRLRVAPSSNQAPTGRGLG